MENLNDIFDADNHHRFYIHNKILYDVLIFISLRILLIFWRSEELKIFLEIPPPFGVLGIKTIYLPAIDMNVLNAAPFKPLSSFNT